MSKQTRRKFAPEFKAKVALEAVKNQQTLSEIGLKYDLSPVVISKWKSELLENMAGVFEKDSKKNEESSPDVEELYAQIGKLKVENEFLKKSCKKLGI
ncbi:MAG: transposase [Algoriphagus aquaeductus]|uniref:transposase n=1 Tax=Algoriphagus aquaeductus TaxID=475299 RepID=UPI0038798848